MAEPDLALPPRAMAERDRLAAAASAETSAARAAATTRPLAARLLLSLLCLGFIGCAVLYSVIAPLWEASDESEHFQYVVYLVEQHALPDRLPTVQPNGNNEANQPPLYYLLTAPLALGLDLSDAARIRMNPHMGWPGAPDGDAAVAHLLDEGWPYHGAFLAAHRIRALSALLGAATILLTYGVALACTRRRATALGAAALLALLPGFLYASATIDNDTLLNLLCAALLLIVVRVEVANSRAALAFGVVAGLGLFTKLTTLTPIGVGAVALLLRAAPRERLRAAVALALPLAPGVAFWLWRRSLGQSNLIGDRVTWPPPLPGGSGPLDWSLPWHFVRELTTSFIGLFGRQNVFLPHALYFVYGAVFGGGLLLAALGPRRLGLTDEGKNRPLLWWWAGLVLFAIVARYFTLTGDRTGYASSRFLYPALPAIVTLTAYGWSLAARRAVALRRAIAPAFAIGAVLALAYPFWVIRPAYQPPFPISDRVPAQAALVQNGGFAAGVTLAAAELPTAPVSAGQGLFVTFYWRVAKPLTDGEWLFVHVEDANGRLAAALDGPPLSGTLPLSSWRSGDVIYDRELLTIHKDAAPGVYTIHIGWYNPKTGQRLSLANGGNQAMAGTLVVKR